MEDWRIREGRGSGTTDSVMHGIEAKQLCILLKNIQRLNLCTVFYVEEESMRSGETHTNGLVSLMSLLIKHDEKHEKHEKHDSQSCSSHASTPETTLCKEASSKLPRTFRSQTGTSQPEQDVVRTPRPTCCIPEPNAPLADMNQRACDSGFCHSSLSSPTQHALQP